MTLMKESLILIAIGLCDLLYTLLLMGGRHATEGNPLMAYYLQFGVGAFVLVKLVLLFLPIFVAEWSKRYKPKFVKWMMRGAIAAYVASYLMMFVMLNVAPVAKDRNYVPAEPVRVAERVKSAHRTAGRKIKKRVEQMLRPLLLQSHGRRSSSKWAVQKESRPALGA